MVAVPTEMGAGEWGRARVVVERWRRVLAVPRPSLYRAEMERRGADRELRGMPPMEAAIGAPEVCGWRCDYYEGRAGDAEGREEEDGSDGWGPLSAEKRGRRKGYFGQY